VRSAPLGTPRTASRVRGSGRRRRAGARLLLAGDNTFEDGLGIIHYCRLGDLLRVVCDEGGRARSGQTRPYIRFCFCVCSEGPLSGEGVAPVAKGASRVTPR